MIRLLFDRKVACYTQKDMHYYYYPHHGSLSISLYDFLKSLSTIMSYVMTANMQNIVHKQVSIGICIINLYICAVKMVSGLCNITIVYMNHKITDIIQTWCDTYIKRKKRSRTVQLSGVWWCSLASIYRCWYSYLLSAIKEHFILSEKCLCFSRFSNKLR